jgi:hypothetical protein
MNLSNAGLYAAQYTLTSLNLSNEERSGKWFNN